MAKAIDVAKGAFVDYNDQPHLVVDREFYSPGKGAAVVRLKLKNIKTGAVVKIVLKTEDTIGEIELEKKDVKFLYGHRDEFCFVDEKNSRIMLSGEAVGEDKDFLKAGEEYRLIFYEDEPISLKVPIKMTFVVKEAEEGMRGNTANTPTKEVTLETGMKIKVPIFVKEGDKLLINTEKREYVSRV